MSEERGEYDAGNKISFLASFPAIQSAITISGNGDGMRLKLDIPETQFVEAILALKMRQKAFRVTIEPMNLMDFEDETKKEPERESDRVGRRRSINRRNQSAGV